MRSPHWCGNIYPRIYGPRFNRKPKLRGFESSISHFYLLFFLLSANIGARSPFRTPLSANQIAVRPLVLSPLLVTARDGPFTLFSHLYVPSLYVLTVALHWSIRFNPVRASCCLVRSNLVWSSAVQATPVRTNPVRLSPVRHNPVRSSAVRPILEQDD